MAHIHVKTFKTKSIKNIDSMKIYDKVAKACFKIIE